MLVPCDSDDEAHFICAALSSCGSAYIVASYALQTSTTTHVLNHVPVPRFDGASRLHRMLSDASRTAHQAARAGDQDEVAGKGAEIDGLAQGLWGLSNAELKNIQDSLADLRQ